MTQLRNPRMPRDERERRILDVAALLFYRRGVHEVGMDELVRETGLGKATVYRLYATKDDLIGAYLGRLSAQILELIDADIARSRTPAAALRRILDSIEADLARPEFRGCPFNNASVEYSAPTHPARVAAHDYRVGLCERFVALGEQLRGRRHGRALGEQLAVLVDGAYTSAAHLGPDGPAAAGLRLARRLIEVTTPGRS